MAANIRKDMDFNGLFRKLGHSLEEIRVRALESINSKLKHKLICDADIVHEKQLYIRLLEWFNIPESSHRADVLSLLNRLSQHSSGAQLLQDIGGIEFLSQLRCDIEPCHRPIIDQILENTMHLPDQDTEVHAPECIYHKPTDSSVWGASMSSAGEGSRTHASESTGVQASASVDRLTQHLHAGPSYFAASVGQTPQPSPMPGSIPQHVSPSELFLSAGLGENSGSLFRLSTFPWLPLTHTDQQVIASTNSSLQTKEPSMLIGACEFLADVVFQDFPAELFLQRPEILKSLLSLVSLQSPIDHSVVIQACKTLTCYIRCLQSRIRYFQDPTLYTSKQDFNSSSPSVVSSITTNSSSSSHVAVASAHQPTLSGWSDRRHRGDGQDGDSSTSVSRDSSVGLEPEFIQVEDDLDHADVPRLQHQQLTLPQLCVAVLQRSLPRLHTAHEALGVGVLELVQEVLTILTSVLDTGLWTDRREHAREVIDRLTDCLDCIAELLQFHHHSRHEDTPLDAELGDLRTHRILYMGLVATLTQFLLMVPLDKINTVVSERLKSCLHTIVYDEPLAAVFPHSRIVCLAVTQSLGLSVPVDFQQALDICRSLTKTCAFCLQSEGGTLQAAELAALAEEAVPSLNYHLHLPFVFKFVQFTSAVCSKKKTDQSVVSQCTDVLLKLMSYPVDSVRQVCYTAVVDMVKKSLHVKHANVPNSKESLKSKFVMNSDVLYEMICFGLADLNAKVRTCAADCLHHLLQSQLLMSEGLWQEFMLALTRSLPVLQSYTDQSTPLGRSLWSMLDPTTTTHNLSLLDKFRGCLRLMFLSDKKLRTEAAKHLKWFLGNEHGSKNKLPTASDLDPVSMSSSLIVSSVQLIEEDSSRSVFTEGGMKQVYDIFTSSPVDPGVKKSAAEQLAIMMKDPYLHALFKERGGVEVVCSVIREVVKEPNGDVENQGDDVPYLPACVSMLRSLAHHDYTLRHTLAKDNGLYYSLIRVILLHQADEQIKKDVSQLLVLLLFDEVARFDIGSGQSETPGTKFSLPASVIQRYRLPFKPSCHHTSSPYAILLPDASSDIMMTSGPREVMKVTWNIAWQGGLEQLLDSFKTQLFSETLNEFDSTLALTTVERTVLEVSAVTWNLQKKVEAIRDALSHEAVMSAIDRILSYAKALRIPTVTEFFSNYNWYTVLEKFLMVNPTSASDQSLLLHVLHTISSILHGLKPRPHVTGPYTALAWLIDKLYRPDGPLVGLMNKQVGGAGDGMEPGVPFTNIKRSLDKELLQYVSNINICLPYQLCKRAKPAQMRGDFVRKLQHRLNITDAPHFYNLASLEGTLACLMHVTARPGWSRECSELDSTSLCNQLLNSLLEVVWSFHIGRGGTSRSFMGKGVTKSTTLCLRHLAYEMIHNSDDQNWVKSWLYTRQDNSSDTDQGLNWLLTLWAYRDAEVRAAGLGIAVALTSTEAGRLLVTANCKHIQGGIWGAAFNVLFDQGECSMVRQQTALLLVNLTSQPMPSGEMETTAGTWQGPLVTDTDYQVMLVGINALIALLDHTNFYASVADLLTSLYTPSLIQPVLVTTEIPLLLDSKVNSTTSSTDTSTLEKTGRTALTTVSSLSAHVTPNLTERSKHTLSAERSKGSSSSSQNNSLSSSTNTDNPQESQGMRRDIFGSHMPDTQQQAAEGRNVATPDFISAVIKLLTNIVNLAPVSCLSNMRSHSIISSLLSLVNPSTVQSLCDEMINGQMGSASALALQDLLLMYGSVAELLTACVTLDTNCRMELLTNKSGLKSLVSLLMLQWQEKDDVGTVCASVSVSVLQLMSALLQTQGVAALNTLTVIMGPIWSPIVESMCTMLDDHSSDRVALYFTCLDFLALFFCEESRSVVKNPDRIVDVATVSELLDASLIDGDTQEPSKDERTSGRQLCKVLVSVFDCVTARSTDEKSAWGTNGRLKVISAFKSLLAVSQTAKISALEAGIVECAIDHIKQTHAQINLETLGILKTGGKKEEPLLQELIMIFDFLRNFMCHNSDVKVACHHSGLTTVIQRLWSWCQQEPALQSSVLSLLITYSAHCNSAAGSLATPMSAQATVKPGSQGSLLHYILKLTQKELDRDECSPTLRQTFSLLTNLAINADCRNVLWKSPFVNQFTQLNPRKRRGKVRIAVEILWCELLLSLSFSVDGQQIILKIPDSLTVLIDMMEAGTTRCQQCATLIIRNLCCHAPNKPKLLVAEQLISQLQQQVQDRTDENTQLVAASALWALIYNNHKARVQVKSANILPGLVDTLHDLQTSGPRSQVTRSTCENLKAIIVTLKD